MIPNHSPEMWKAIAPAIGDHLWQSTLFAVIAGLLTLILRKNHARAREISGMRCIDLAVGGLATTRVFSARLLARM
jgi:hypothetical protein